MLKRNNASLLAGAVLVIDIDLRGGIVSDHNYG
jgi:hypothetical protein